MTATLDRIRPTADAPAAPRCAMPPLQPAAWARSERLALREFGFGDANALMRMHRDPRVRETLVDDYPLDQPAVVQLFLARLLPLYRRHEGMGVWHASLLDAAHSFVGWFNLMPMADRAGEVEIGSRLLPAAWGAGLVHEGCALLLDHAFDRLGLSRVWGVTHPGNRSAHVVLQTLGFGTCGVLPYYGREATHQLIEAATWRAWRAELRRLGHRRALRLLRRAPIVKETDR